MPENDIKRTKEEMIKSILTPKEMQEKIKEDDGKEKKRWEEIALSYMEKMRTPQKINSAKVEILEGTGMQLHISADDIQNKCALGKSLLPEDLTGVLDAMVEIIGGAGHNVSHKNGGNGVKILEICPPVPHANKVLD